MASRSEIARQDQATEQRRDAACATLLQHAAVNDTADVPDRGRGVAVGVVQALIEAIDGERDDIVELRRKGWQSRRDAHETATAVLRDWRDRLVAYTRPASSALPAPASIAVSHRADTPAELEQRLTEAFGTELASVRHIRTVLEPSELNPSERHGALCGGVTGSWTHPGGSNCVECHLIYAEHNDGKPYDGPGHVDVPALLTDAVNKAVDAPPSDYGHTNPLGDAQPDATWLADKQAAVAKRRNGPVTPADDLKPMHPAELAEHRALDLATGAPGGYVIGDTVTVGGVQFTKIGDWPREADGSPSPGTAADVAAVTMPTIIEPPARRPARMRMTATQVREHGLARLRGAEHRSVSQVSGHADCGTRYAISDLERPAWWNVGGKAFHACAEEINRTHTAPTADPMLAVGDLESLWLRHFDQQIAEQCAASPEHPIDTWRAANKGSEHYDFWRVEGPAMMQRYVVWLSGMLQEGWFIATAPPPVPRHGSEWADQPVIEFECRLNVGLAVPNLSIIDLALIRADGANPTGTTVLIVDLKAGESAPKDTFQLGVYGWALLAAGVAQRPEQVRGAYYRARKGEIAPDVAGLIGWPVLDMHPWTNVVQRYRDQDAMDRAGIYAPNVTTFCGGCGVRDLCPAQAS